MIFTIWHKKIPNRLKLSGNGRKIQKLVKENKRDHFPGLAKQFLNISESLQNNYKTFKFT